MLIFLHVSNPYGAQLPPGNPYHTSSHVYRETEREEEYTGHRNRNYTATVTARSYNTGRFHRDGLPIRFPSIEGVNTIEEIRLSRLKDKLKKVKICRRISSTDRGRRAFL